METFDVILPAGGKIDPVLAARAGTDVKALIKFGDKTILQRTLEALRDSGLTDRMVVIGGPEVCQQSGGLCTEALPEGGSGPDNIYKGLEYLLKEKPGLQKVMIVTTDLPFLTPELIRKFVQLCPTDREICVPLVRKSEWDARFPNSGATFVTLKDDTWTTGCIYILDVPAMMRIRPQIEKVFERRKSKLGMARLIGLGFVLKYVTKQLTVKDVESKIKSLLGCTGAAVTGAPPELSYDIDYLDDYEYALSHVKESA